MIKYILFSGIQIALFNWQKNSSYLLKLVLSGIGKGNDHSIVQYVAHLNNHQGHNTNINFFCFYLKSHLLLHINNNTRGVKSSHDMDHRLKLTIENSTQSCTCFDNGIVKFLETMNPSKKLKHTNHSFLKQTKTYKVGELKQAHLKKAYTIASPLLQQSTK